MNPKPQRPALFRARFGGKPDLHLSTTSWFVTTAFLTFAAHAASLFAQTAPAAPGAVWQSKEVRGLRQQLTATPSDEVRLEKDKTYSLAELIDLAELHNPETRVAWEDARSKAASLGIARSSLYPTISAVAIAVTLRQAALIGEFYHRQTEGLFVPELHVEYLVFDAGGRSGEIDAAKANLLAADLAFNDTHRRVIYEVASAYYRLLNAEGQRQAAEVSLENAKTVEEDATARLANGLATRPDRLEATAARAQADYDLQARIGAVDIARGDLATVIGIAPGTVFRVEDIDSLKLPSTIASSVDEEIQRAFGQRPDLLQQLTRLRAADAEIKQSRSTYFPSLSFKGEGGEARAYGQQDLLPRSYAEGEIWTAELELRWTLFDGARREYRIAQAKDDKKAALAEIGALRDRIANQVWSAYSNMQTAIRQQQSASALLTASQESYESAHEAYGYGVRNLLDVVSAQKALAQARSEDISARTQLLLEVTNMAFQTGDLIQIQHWSPAP